LSKGGTNTLSNIVLCCHECNQNKGDMMPGDFWRAGLNREVDYAQEYKTERLAAAAMGFCRNCLLWGEQTVRDGNHIVNGAALAGDFKFNSTKALVNAVREWCDANDGILETSYHKGSHMARVRFASGVADNDDVEEWQHAESGKESLLHACIAASAKLKG
jgi:hypothetical protein